MTIISISQALFKTQTLAFKIKQIKQNPVIKDKKLIKKLNSILSIECIQWRLVSSDTVDDAHEINVSKPGHVNRYI